MSAEVIGYLAGILTALSQLPQALKAWRERSTDDLSLKTMIFLAAGLSLWIAFGVARGEWPIIASNGVSLLITLSVVAAKLRFG